jgi:TldD protein
MKKLLEIALSKGGDFSELFFEYRLSTSLTYEEDIVKSSSENITLGVGIRVLNNDQTGYAYTNDLTFDKIRQTCLTAAAIASGASKYKVANLNELKVSSKLYDLGEPLSKLGLDDKLN